MGAPIAAKVSLVVDGPIPSKRSGPKIWNASSMRRMRTPRLVSYRFNDPFEHLVLAQRMGDLGRRIDQVGRCGREDRQHDGDARDDDAGSRAPGSHEGQTERHGGTASEGEQGRV